MSKDGLPTLKDGELFGDVLKQPIVVRYHGVDTQTVEGAALVAARAGEVNRFVTKGRQAYSLSGRTHLAVRGQITDGDARYTNQFGNEIVDVRVNTPKPGERPEPAKDYWDWAVINLNIENAENVSMAVVGFLIPAPTTVPPGVAGDHIPGLAAADGVALAYPLAADATHATVRPLRRTSSLRVDLRRFRGLTAVGIDLYGSVVSTTATSVLTGYQRHTVSETPSSTVIGVAHFDSGTGIWTPPLASFYFSDFAVGDNNADRTTVSVADAPIVPDLQDFPSIFDIKEEYTYEPVSGLLLHHVHHIIQNSDFTAPITGDYNQYEVIEDDVYSVEEVYGPGPPEPITRVADVRVSLHKGAPRWSVASQPDPGDGFTPARWDDRVVGRSEGARTGHVTMNGDVTEPTDEIANHYGQPYLGRVTIDLIYGAAGFKPAP